MKLASLRSGSRDGELIVVNQLMTHFIRVGHIAPTLQNAIENWETVFPELQSLYTRLNASTVDTETLVFENLLSPLPRAYQWLDGSAYLSHVERVRKARNAEMPPSFLHDPLMYQGASDEFFSPRENIIAGSEDWGVDLEAEVGIITDDVPMGTPAKSAEQHIKLLMLINDVSFRGLIPSELAKGFGFLHGKPSTAFSPIAITPDELNAHWENSKICLPLQSEINGDLLGNPEAGVDMQFNFSELIAHAAKTRKLSAGTIIGSGTVSNQDLSAGCSCLAEKRVLEIIDSGEAKTPFLKSGDRVCIEMFDPDGQSLFGKIDQTVVINSACNE